MRRVHEGLAWVLLAGIVLQFFLVGYGIFSGRTGDISKGDKLSEVSTLDAHRVVGSALVAVGLLLLLAALAGRMGGRDIGTSALLFVLTLVQSFLAHLGSEHGNGLLGGLHGVNAIVLLGLTIHVVVRDRRLRAAPVAAGGD